MTREAWLWISWSLVALYGACFSARELWPLATSALRRCRATSAWAGSGGIRAVARAQSLPLLQACGWLLAWVGLCSAWAALLLWSGSGIWDRQPLFQALFG